jgi:hypothetical protein
MALDRHQACVWGCDIGIVLPCSVSVVVALLAVLPYVSLLLLGLHVVVAKIANCASCLNMY